MWDLRPEGLEVLIHSDGVDLEGDCSNSVSEVSCHVIRMGDMKDRRYNRLRTVIDKSMRIADVIRVISSIRYDTKHSFCFN